MTPRGEETTYITLLDPVIGSRTGGAIIATRYGHDPMSLTRVVGPITSSFLMPSRTRCHSTTRRGSLPRSAGRALRCHRAGNAGRAATFLEQARAVVPPDAHAVSLSGTSTPPNVPMAVLPCSKPAPFLPAGGGETCEPAPHQCLKEIITLKEQLAKPRQAGVRETTCPALRYA